MDKDKMIWGGEQPAAIGLLMETFPRPGTFPPHRKQGHPIRAAGLLPTQRKRIKSGPAKGKAVTR